MLKVEQRKRVYIYIYIHKLIYRMIMPYKYMGGLGC